MSCIDAANQPRTAFARAVLRILQGRAVWNVEPWTGTLTLNVTAAWSLLDRLWRDADPDGAGQYFSAYEAGAVTGWAKVRHSKTKE